MGKLLIRATRRISPAHIRYVRPVPAATATGLVGRVYDQVEADFGMLAPPIALHAAAPPVLAACWSMLRETLLAPGRVSRADKEAVAAAVSLANRCPYCVDVHGATLLGLQEGPDADRIAAGRIEEVAQPRLRALARWALASGEPGRPAPPFPVGRSPELIGVVQTFHYINRMVNVFLRESPFPTVPSRAGRLLRESAARVLGGLTRVPVLAGTSLELLPPAAGQAGPAWAEASPSIHAAMARSTAVLTAAGESSVPEGVRELVGAVLDDPRFARPGLDVRLRIDDEVTALPALQRPAARLALLTAVASYRVTPDLVEDFQRDAPGDTRLIELTSWASFTAATRIAERLAPQ